VTSLVLVHGGLYEGMTPDRFWHGPGVVRGLEEAGLVVATPARIARPTSWLEEAAHLAAAIADRDAVIVGGSNGCSAVLRLALDDGVGSRLVLCWPATGGDPLADDVARMGMRAASVPDHVIDVLLAGGTIRGVTDEELARLPVAVSIIPSEPENPLHTSATVARLAALLPQAHVHPGFPEPPDPRFPPRCDEFVAELILASTA